MLTTPPLRDSLVDHAMRLLDANENDVSLRAVARAAGVSAMAPYRHFPDKAALLDAVTERGFAILRDTLVEADGRGGLATPAQALVGQGMAYVAFAQARPALFRLMFSGGEATPEGACAGEAYGVLAARVVTVCAGKADTATMAAWGIVHGLATLSLERRLPAEPAAIRATLDLFVDGLTKKGPAA